jgi:starvation-inducible DNA-binding protein
MNSNGLKRDETMVDIGLPQKDRVVMAEQLQKLLANEYVLYTKTLKYHWNVEGKLFGPLHKLFNEQYEQLLVVVDDVAERIRALGFKPMATLQEFLAETSLVEDPGVNPDDMGMIKNLLMSYEAIIKQLRDMIDTSAEINDMGTNNFLSDLLERHEKTAWMLRAHLM